jgi:hypothetical protein
VIVQAVFSIDVIRNFGLSEYGQIVVAELDGADRSSKSRASTIPDVVGAYGDTGGFRSLGDGLGMEGIMAMGDRLCELNVWHGWVTCGANGQTRLVGNLQEKKRQWRAVCENESR